MVNLIERLQQDFCLLTERKQSPATEGACIVGSLRRKFRQLRGPRWHRHCDVIRAATCTHPGSKGDVELLRRARVKSNHHHSDHYSIFFPFISFENLQNFHLSAICFFLLLLNTSLKTRGFGKFINQWMSIILFLDRWIENLWLLSALQIYLFFFFFHLSRFIIKIQFHNIYIYSSSNINCRWKKTNEHSFSTFEPIQTIIITNQDHFRTNDTSLAEKLYQFFSTNIERIYKYFIIDHIRKHSRRVDCNFNLNLNEYLYTVMQNVFNFTIG